MLPDCFRDFTAELKFQPFQLLNFEIAFDCGEMYRQTGLVRRASDAQLEVTFSDPRSRLFLTPKTQCFIMSDDHLNPFRLRASVIERLDAQHVRFQIDEILEIGFTRASDRVQTQLKAEVVATDGQLLTTAFVTQLSAGGAQLTLHQPITEDDFQLVFQTDAAPLTLTARRHLESTPSRQCLVTFSALSSTTQLRLDLFCQRLRRQQVFSHLQRA